MATVDDAPSTTGRSVVVEETPAEGPSFAARPPLDQVLVLRAAPSRPKSKKNRKKGVSWSEDVVDNEFLNKKKSKKCCIFHKQRPFGEWSDEDSDTECQCEQ